MLTMLVATKRKNEDSQSGLCSKFQASQGCIETLFQNKTKRTNKQKKENLKANCLQPSKHSHS